MEEILIRVKLHGEGLEDLQRYVDMLRAHNLSGQIMLEVESPEDFESLIELAKKNKIDISVE